MFINILSTYLQLNLKPMGIIRTTTEMFFVQGYNSEKGLETILCILFDTENSLQKQKQTKIWYMLQANLKEW